MNRGSGAGALGVLFGRERERRIAVDLLRSDMVRLLTITGTGGIGKTTLALAIARDLQAEFGAEVVQVSLAHIDNPDLVMAEIGQALGLQDDTGVSAFDRICAHLRDRQVVLVLDNLEQVRAAGPEIVAIVKRCPGVTVLATSRIPMNVTFEQQFALAPLPLPEDDMDSVEALRDVPSIAMFTQRAKARKFDFELTEANAAAVAAICARVDGIPLAIELAAARIKVLSPAALLARLNEGIEVLSGGPQDQPDRLRTVRDAIQWSYGLLSPAEQVIFRQLAVCSGGFTLDAAAAIVDPMEIAPARILSILEQLVEWNLIQMDEAASDEPRFTMYVPIREFGLSVLRDVGQYASCRERHAEWFAGFAERAWNAYAYRIDTGLWFNRLDADLDNLRSAIAWSAEAGTTDRELLLAGHISLFLYMRGSFKEARGLLDLALGRPDQGSDRARAVALFGLGCAGHVLRDERTVDLLRESYQVAERAGDGPICCQAAFMLGMVAEDTGDFARAEPLLLDARNLARELNLPGLEGLATLHLGMVTWGRGDVERGIAHAEQALTIQTAMGDRLGVALTASFVGLAECDRGNLERAEALFRQSLDIRLEMQNWTNLANCLDNFATLASERGQWSRAVRLFAAAEAVRNRYGQWLREPEGTRYRTTQEQLRSKLTPQTWQREWEAGTAMSWEEAVAESRSTGQELKRNEIQPRGEYGLSARELDVLELLVSGQTDREIAEALYISPRTAQGHVAHIFDKLGVNTRATAVAIAVREGLVQGEGRSVTG